MTFTEYAEKYETILKDMLKYTTEQVGFLHYAEQLSDLEENYPAFAEKYDNQY